MSRRNLLLFAAPFVVGICLLGAAEHLDRTTRQDCLRQRASGHRGDRQADFCRTYLQLQH